MKHILNDLSDDEKNRIREQHTGGKKITIENFNNLVNTKLGDSKPFLNEQAQAVFNVETGISFVQNVLNTIQKDASKYTNADSFKNAIIAALNEMK